MKLPAIQFYPADWRKDPGVQSLNFFDRGVWFEIICLMHESPERGKLTLNGGPMPDEALARLLGIDSQTLDQTLSTLLKYGVASREESGALINRRMLRDEQTRRSRTEAGRKGGNPLLLNHNPTPSSSSSVSSSTATSSSEKTEERAEPRPAKSKLCDDEYLNELQSDEAYKLLNVRIVHAKMLRWCAEKRKTPTRMRLINWLNREDVPMEKTNGANQPPGYQTATERRDSDFQRKRAIVDELRSNSRGTAN